MEPEPGQTWTIRASGKPATVDAVTKRHIFWHHANGAELITSRKTWHKEMTQ